MLCGNGREGVVADGATNRGVFRHAWTEREWHRVSSSWQGLSAHTALQAPYLTPSPVQLMYDSTSCKDLTPAVSRARKLKRSVSWRASAPLPCSAKPLPRSGAC